MTLGSSIAALALAVSMGPAQEGESRVPQFLTDETVVDRFRLWSISNIGISLSFAVFLAGRLFTENVGQAPWVLICTSVVGLVSGTAMWLAFFPPQRYLRRFAA